MSRLHALLDDYLAMRRGLGFKLRAERLLLPGFVDFVERTPRSSTPSSIRTLPSNILPSSNSSASHHRRTTQNNVGVQITVLKISRILRSPTIDSRMRACGAHNPVFTKNALTPRHQASGARCAPSASSPTQPACRRSPRAVPRSRPSTSSRSSSDDRCHPQDRRHRSRLSAYARKFAGSATYFVYFQDNLWGAVALHNFAEMLRLAWGQPPQPHIVEQDLSLKHPAVLELLRQSGAFARADRQRDR